MLESIVQRQFQITDEHGKNRLLCKEPGVKSTDSAKVLRLLVLFVVGSVACLTAAIALLITGARAEVASAYNPGQTETPITGELPTPHATDTPCALCAPSPTWTPWWAVPTCEPGINCETPYATRTSLPLPPVRITTTPQPGPTLRLVPSVQFGHVRADGTARYNLRLVNHFAAETTVEVNTVSDKGWPIAVRPEHMVAHPEAAGAISVTVSVPASRTSPVDVERIVAQGEQLASSVTATAYLVTIATRYPFADVLANHWADGPIQLLSNRDIVSGYADGSFHPDGNVTRAQLAKMLVGIMGWEIQVPANPTFSDVGSNFWAYRYIETAVAHRVISGYSDGTFRPSAGVTRAQIAKVVVTAHGWQVDAVAAESSFSDVSSDDWLYDYAQVASAAGVIAGYSDGTFRPYSYATRAQIARILALSLFSRTDN